MVTLNGGTIAVSYSSLTRQGVLYFMNNSNGSGGAIILRNSEHSICGFVVFEGNEAFIDSGAISATHSYLFISSK